LIQFLPPIAPPCLFFNNISLIILSFPATGATGDVIAVSGICTAVTAAVTAAAGTATGVETVGNRIEDAGIGIGVSMTGAFFAASAAVAAAAVTGDGITSGDAS
jgi:hypothetical protein